METAVTKELQVHFESESCPVCGAEKWARYPFCRSCSIKLQRAHLMRLLQSFNDPQNQMDRWPKFAKARYFKLYDICKDYLIVTRRDPPARKRPDRDYFDENKD